MTDTGRIEPHVLVAYATRFGSTRGIADRIATRLRELGVATDLRDAHELVDVGGYDAVVFGGAVFDQRWPPEGEQLIRGNADALADRPVWLFSVGSFGDTRRIVGRLVAREPKGIDALCRTIRPRGYRVFAGVLEREHWPLVGRLFLRAFGGRFGDNRDWAAIDAWAGSIATELRADGRAGFPLPRGGATRMAGVPAPESIGTPREPTGGA
jgi:menaquinone-dependent protoporphyrinogen oxidase